MSKDEAVARSRRERLATKGLSCGRSFTDYVESLRNAGLDNGEIDRVERLREVLQSIYEANKFVPAVVEGKRDVKALRHLGLDGNIISLHGGKGLYEFAEGIAERYDRVILLTDWDEKGEQLFKITSRLLEGLWEEFASFREILRALCQKDVKDIEGIPALMRRLSGMEVRLAGPEEGEG